LSLLWRNTHCRKRRKIEEYSSLKVTDSDNNSIIKSVEFSEPSFRTNLQNPSYFFFTFTSDLHFHLGIQNADFHFRIQKKDFGSSLSLRNPECRLSLQNAKEGRGLCFVFFLCFKMGEKERYL